LPQLLSRLRGHVFLDRTPIDGFSGHVYLSPVGMKPEVPKPQPERPMASVEDEEEI
jgi:hypothetical protein